LLPSWLPPSNKTVFNCRPEEAARSRAQPLFRWDTKFLIGFPLELAYKAMFRWR
jgi:hypothetical protein